MDYHQDRFDDYSLLLFKANKLLAILPANFKETTVYSHQGLSYGGFVYEEDLKLETIIKLFKALLEYLNATGIEKLKLKVIPSIYSKVPSDEVDYIMYLCDARLERRDALSVIDLGQPYKFTDSRLEGCKRAVKHALEIKEEENFDEFWTTILEPNLKERHNANPVHSLKEIKELKNVFPNQIRQFNVYNKGHIVAGTTIFETQNVAHVQYISGNDERSTLGSLDFLFSYLIKDVFKEKAFFDLGNSNENQGRNVNSGLQFWKEGFGARTITQDFYNVSTKSYENLNGVLL